MPDRDQLLISTFGVQGAMLSAFSLQEHYVCQLADGRVSCRMSSQTTRLKHELKPQCTKQTSFAVSFDTTFKLTGYPNNFSSAMFSSPLASCKHMDTSNTVFNSTWIIEASN
eukprot:1161995-Pelagomonas_calceolata.AAC.8